MVIFHSDPYGDLYKDTSRRDEREAIWDELPVQGDEHTGTRIRLSSVFDLLNRDVGLKRGDGWPVRLLPLVDYRDAVVTGERSRTFAKSLPPIDRSKLPSSGTWW